jgi:anti-sigma factor RsiW
MADRHLTDTEIQRYLEGDLTDRYPLRAAHLENCSNCQQEVSSYRELYATLGSVETPPLRDGFAVEVTSEAIRELQRERTQRLANIGMMAVAGLVLAVVSWYYLDWAIVGHALAKLNLDILALTETALGSFSKITPESTPRLQLIGISVLVLMIMGMADLVWRNTRNKTITLSL